MFNFQRNKSENNSITSLSFLEKKNQLRQSSLKIATETHAEANEVYFKFNKLMNSKTN